MSAEAKKTGPETSIDTHMRRQVMISYKRLRFLGGRSSSDRGDAPPSVEAGIDSLIRAVSQFDLPGQD